MAVSDIESCGFDIEIDARDIEMESKNIEMEGTDIEMLGSVIGFKERWRLANFCQMVGETPTLLEVKTVRRPTRGLRCVH